MSEIRKEVAETGTDVNRSATACCQKRPKGRDCGISPLSGVLGYSARAFIRRGVFCREGLFAVVLLCAKDMRIDVSAQRKISRTEGVTSG